MEKQLIALSFSLDTFYLLICGALVMWMAAGFAMLEAGLVRSKNTTEILTKNIALFAISCTMYLLCGYAIMYPTDGVSLLFLADITNETGRSYAYTADFFFQVVFVATCMSIVSGAVAERLKLWAFLLFAVIMTGFIYPLEGYWTWSGGEVFGLFQIKGKSTGVDFQDFAGAGIVHIAGAAAALAGVLLLGPRKGKYGAHGEIRAIPGANLPLAALGTLILWMGWFGFNGGSQLSINGLDNASAVARIFVNTNAAAAGGAIAALLLARAIFGKADLTMLLNGVLAGLVVITAAPDTPSPLQSLLFGGLGGLLVVCSILLLDKLKIDDPVGAISVHGVCGLLGLLLVPITHKTATWGMQLLGAVVIFGWVFVASLIIWFVIKKTIGMRLSEAHEYEGADIAECGMEAYPEFTK